MPQSYDIIIRGGQVADGGGGEPFEADVAVRDGTIVAVGAVVGDAREEIQADGRLVTPGFVDLHTHYDGQATWDSRLDPSSSHGVTTVVMGNCGVGFAPCRPQDRQALIRLMEGVEDIPGAALSEGLTWQWESFGDYLDELDRRPHDVDVAAQIPHGALRVYAMGQRGIDRDPATPDDIATMATLVDQAMSAGALGLATSRSIAHRTADGDYTPMYEASAAELKGLCAAIGQRGVFQLVSDFRDEAEEFELLRQAAQAGVAGVSFSVLQTDGAPDKWRSLLARAEAANTEGLPIRAQTICRPVGVLMGLTASLHPFRYRPSYVAIADLPLEARCAAMAADSTRKAILAERDTEAHPLLTYFEGAAAKLFPLDDPPDYAPPASASFAARAARENRRPEEVIYDYLLEDGGRSLIYLPLYNYAAGDLAVVEEMLRHPLTLQGLGDGGAHVGAICDASATTYLLAAWVRDRGALPLGKAIAALTRQPAQHMGLRDRGLLAPGLKADINIIDLQALSMGRPHVVHDLPAGGGRLLQASGGYDMTIVSGVVTRRDGVPTDALPGRVVRGRRAPRPFR